MIKWYLKNLSVLKQAGVADIKWPNGFVHLHQGRFTDDGLNKMI